MKTLLENRKCRNRNRKNRNAWRQNELNEQKDVVKQDVVEHCGLIQLVFSIILAAIFDCSWYIYRSKLYSEVCGGISPELPVRHNLKALYYKGDDGDIYGMFIREAVCIPAVQIHH